MAIAYWPFLALAAGFFALEIFFPGLFTRKYFDNIYIEDADTHLPLMFVFLGAISGFDDRNRVKLSRFWLRLVLGSLVVASVADIWFSAVLPRFYLTVAIGLEFTGAIFGFVLRPRSLAGLFAHIFDRAVSPANRLLRLGLVMLPVALAIFVAATLVYGGEWRAATDPHWREWPNVGSFIWGFATGLLWLKADRKEAAQQTS